MFKFARNVAIAIAGLGAVAASAQERVGPKFEVASVRFAVPDPPASAGAGGREGGGSNGGGCPQLLRVNGGRVDVRCASLTTLIGYSFRISPERVTGPDWMDRGSTRWDIAAKMPEGASGNQVPEMMQALLTERFHLAAHRGTKNQTIYALLVTQGGLKVKEAAPEADATLLSAESDSPATAMTFFGGVTTRTIPNADGKGSSTRMSNPRMGIVLATEAGDRLQRWDAPSITFEGLADLLEKVTPFFSSPVIDMTGLKGRYGLVLEVNLNDALGSAGGDRTASDIEAAVLKAFNDGLRKLGLRLERRKGPVESVVVDRLEKVPTEN